MNKSNFDTAWKSSLRNKRYLILVLMMLTISFLVSGYKERICEDCEEAEARAKPIIDLVSNAEKIKFIQKHKFNGKGEGFREFVAKLSYKTYSKIISIDPVSESKIGNVRVNEIKITGLFWHDSFIFDFLDNLQNFSPGFLSIVSIDIDKFSKQISQKPTMKLEVVCKVFQK